MKVFAAVVVGFFALVSSASFAAAEEKDAVFGNLTIECRVAKDGMSLLCDNFDVSGKVKKRTGRFIEPFVCGFKAGLAYDACMDMAYDVLMESTTEESYDAFMTKAYSLVQYEFKDPAQEERRMDFLEAVADVEELVQGGMSPAEQRQRVMEVVGGK